MSVKSIRNVSMLLIVAVHCIQHTTNYKAVAIIVLPQASPPGGLLLDGQVNGVESADHYHFLQGAHVINGRVDDPKTIFINCKVYFRVALPPPGSGLVKHHIMQMAPGCHKSLPQVIFDDIACECSVVVESPMIYHMASPNPIVGKFV